MCQNYLDVIKRPHIYIDYESNKAGNIYLLGYQIEETFSQIIMDTRLQGLAKHHDFKITTPTEGTYKLLNYAKKTGSVIVAYSEAERNIFGELSNFFDSSEFHGVPYLNILKAAKKWISSFKSDEFNALPPFTLGANQYQASRLRRALCSVMRLTSFHAPTDYAPGNTTSRLNAVANALLMRNHNYSNLTPTQKSKATKALKHNKFDVEALPILFNAIHSDSVECFSRSIKNCF